MKIWEREIEKIERINGATKQLIGPGEGFGEVWVFAKVFKKKADFKKAVPGAGNVDAAFVEVRAKETKKTIMGYLLFPFDNTGGGTVAHEIYHATEAIGRGLEEEDRAKLCEHLTMKFYQWYWAEIEPEMRNTPSLGGVRQ